MSGVVFKEKTQLFIVVKEFKKMLTVATIRCRGNTASGVRWAFVVAFLCLSNLAVAGFVPARVGTLHDRQCDSFGWMTELLIHPTTDGGLTGRMSGTEAPPTPAYPSEPALPKNASLAGLLVPTGGSTGAGDSVGRQTLTFTAFLQNAVILGDPQLVSRLDADANHRLSPKLPYKMFRPPKVA